jgi:hypothetical protein
MEDVKKEVKIVRVGTATHLAGTLWLIGWLFTIGLAHLGWWKGVLAIVVWPYFLALVVR